MEAEFVRLFISIGSAVIMLALSVIYPLRKFSQAHKTSLGGQLYRLRKILSKPHKKLGVLVVLLIFTHAAISWRAIDINIATGLVCAVLLAAVIATYLLGKHFKNWLSYHRFFTLMLWFCIAAHIILQLIFE